MAILLIKHGANPNSIIDKITKELYLFLAFATFMSVLVERKSVVVTSNGHLQLFS